MYKRAGETFNGWDVVKITEKLRWARVLYSQRGQTSDDFDLLIDELLVRLVCSCQRKRVRERGLALLHAGDDVRAADPVGFGEICGRPAGGMIGVGMVEADNVFAAFTAFALNAHQFAGIDVVAVLRRVRTGVAAARGRGHRAGAIILEAAEQDAAAFVRVGFFAMAA